MLIFYQFCRVLDDLADEDGVPLDQRAEALQAWEFALQTGSGLPDDLADVFRRHRIGPEWPLEILAGVCSDLEAAPLPDFAALQAYCHQVAVAVGLISNQITGCRSPKSKHYAEALGMALQLTNILRDVREDALRGRCYFPADELQAAGLSRSDFLRNTTSPQAAEFFARQGQRAAGFFAQAQASLPPEDARALSAARTMHRLYQMLWQEMARRNWHVLEGRISLPLWKKLWALR
jgi:phytoene synthase